MLKGKRLLTAIIIFGCAFGLATAEENQIDGSLKDVGSLIRDLDSVKFAEREAASRRLLEAGAQAIDAVAIAAQSDSREVSGRAFDLLRRWAECRDPETKSAARSALRDLAASGKTRVARRAGRILDPPSDLIAGAFPVQPRVQIFPIGPMQAQVQIRGGNIQVGGGKIQIAGGQNIRLVQQTNINGVKRTNVVDGDKKISISEDPKEGIKVKFTEKENGQEKTTEVTAKDADELKKKNPKAHELYKQYSGNAQGIGLQIIGGGQPLVPEKEEDDEEDK